MPAFRQLEASWTNGSEEAGFREVGRCPAHAVV